MEALETASKVAGIAPTEPTENRISPITIDGLTPKLRAAVDNAGWDRLMPVQSKAIPYILAGNDVMVQSRTGSGKTGGFILPTLEKLDPAEATCQALVLVPTRELANQVAAEARMLCGDSGVQVVAVYGGVSYGPQRAAFRKGAHLVVGTPGRVLDHLDYGAFSLENLKTLIFDEADRMLSVGFYPDMKAVQRHLPKRKVHTLMFSATFPPHVIRLANEFLSDPSVLSLSSDHVHVTDVQHIAYHLGSNDRKDDTLIRLIEAENPNSAIVFCNTKTKVNYVAVVLQRYGFNADQLSGDLTQTAREKVLAKVRAGDLRFLIATDVAARGIDIPDLSHVIQYDVPQHPETYIHRAGRTGRAGASGTAIMLVELLDQINLGRINKEYEIDMQVLAPPAEEETFEMIEQRARTSIRAKYRQLNPSTREKLDEYESMVELLTMDEDGLRALSMLIDDFYQNEIHGSHKSSGKRGGKVPAVTNTVMADIAGELMEKMQTRDKLQLDRMVRFEPLVESLAMSGQGFYALTMLVHDFHLSIAQPSGGSGGGNRNNKGGRNRRNGNNNGNSGGRGRRGGGRSSNSGRGNKSQSGRSSRGGGRGRRNNNNNR